MVYPSLIQPVSIQTFLRSTYILKGLQTIWIIAGYLTWWEFHGDGDIIEVIDLGDLRNAGVGGRVDLGGVLAEHPRGQVDVVHGAVVEDSPRCLK